MRNASVPVSGLLAAFAAIVLIPHAWAEGPAEWPFLKHYDQAHLARIALPVGGIGTGTVSLGGRGDLRDWEIANRPAKGFNPAGAFFAIRLKAEGAPPSSGPCRARSKSSNTKGPRASRTPPTRASPAFGNARSTPPTPSVRSTWPTPAFR